LVAVVPKVLALVVLVCWKSRAKTGKKTGNAKPKQLIQADQI
jgi:hypothetical protein